MSADVQPTSDRWRFDPCARPVQMRRTTASILTGEVLTADFQVRCGTRRAEDCPACAKVWQNDAFHALLRGANRATELTFITFTAPGSSVFGPVHTARYHGRASERCACRRYHRPADPRVGTPVDPDTFAYAAVAAFNHAAPRLTAVTMQKVWRIRAVETGLSQKEARLPLARVMEWQRRGVLHVHLIVQGHVSAESVQAAVRGRKAEDGRRTVLPAMHAGFHWGEQVDVRHVKASDALQLAAYVTKVVGYAIKDVTAHLDDTGGSPSAGLTGTACTRLGKQRCRAGDRHERLVVTDGRRRPSTSTDAA
ncbi:MAG: replication initiator [Candidatus Nanopelagicales bacterium]